MANENTHLYLASIIRRKLPKTQQETINKNPNLYYLGAMAPDIFLYSVKFRPFAKRMQSRGILKDLIKNSDKKSLPFIYGYITHIETDEVFHRVVPKDTYEHLYAETSVDKYLGLKKLRQRKNTGTFLHLLFFHPQASATSSAPAAMQQLRM